MKDICMHNEKSRPSLKFIIHLTAVTVAVVIVFGATTYTSYGQGRAQETPQRRLIRFFDPFELNTIYLNVPQSGSNTGVSNSPETMSPVIETNSATEIPNTVITQAPIIPQRRPIRSPYRPPWVPGPPPWPPGPPPWPPGPPPWPPGSPS